MQLDCLGPSGYALFGSGWVCNWSVGTLNSTVGLLSFVHPACRMFYIHSCMLHVLHTLLPVDHGPCKE